MAMNGHKRPTDEGDVASALAALFTKLGFVAVIRHPDTADVVAATPHAEHAMRTAPPGSIRIASARINGELVRVEVVPAPPDAPVQLTHRQAEVARLVADGLQNGAIAERLGISAHTVRRHMEAILRSLNVSSRAAAAEELRSGRAHGVGAGIQE